MANKTEKINTGVPPYRQVFFSGLGARLPAAAPLRAATLGGAVAVGRQDELGTLEPGKFADLIVIDKNPLSCPPQELHQAQVLACYVGGNKVYETA